MRWIAHLSLLTWAALDVGRTDLFDRDRTCVTKRVRMDSFVTCESCGGGVPLRLASIIATLATSQANAQSPDPALLDMLVIEGAIITTDAIGARPAASLRRRRTDLFDRDRTCVTKRVRMDNFVTCESCGGGVPLRATGRPRVLEKPECQRACAVPLRSAAIPAAAM